MDAERGVLGSQFPVDGMNFVGSLNRVHSRHDEMVQPISKVAPELVNSCLRDLLVWIHKGEDRAEADGLEVPFLLGFAERIAIDHLAADLLAILTKGSGREL